MQKTFIILVGPLLFGLSAIAVPASIAADNQKTESSKGLTVDDLGRGLKSAAQNVEKEIPKIGSAVGETFKKMTDKSSDKKPSQESSKDKK